tara:strand:+ start:35 stop:757 length:723 start_codon:yes stop_codon:yes gene_type:complete
LIVIKTYKNIFIGLFIVLLFTGCAPSFSEFQTADLAGEGTLEVTPYISTAKGSEISLNSMEESSSDETVDLQGSKGVRIAYGLSGVHDFHFRYESIEAESGYAEGYLISSGFKFKIPTITQKHRFAFYFPISYYSQESVLSLSSTSSSSEFSNQEEMHYITLEPTLLGSSQLFNKFDINYSGKIIKQISGDDTDEDMLYVLNCSLTLPISKVASLIPEYGVCKAGDQSYIHSGIGILIKL